MFYDSAHTKCLEETGHTDRKQHGGCHGWERGTEGTVWWVEGLSWEDEKALEREAWGCSHK